MYTISLFLRLYCFWNNTNNEKISNYILTFMYYTNVLGSTKQWANQASVSIEGIKDVILLKPYSDEDHWDDPMFMSL